MLDLGRLGDLSLEYRSALAEQHLGGQGDWIMRSGHQAGRIRGND